MITQQVKQELPRVSSRKMSDQEISELIGLVSSKMILEAYAICFEGLGAEVH
jgi:hypothetical protein